MRIEHFAITAVATLMLCSSLVGQQTQPPRTQDRQSQGNQDRNTSEASQAKDQTLAKILAIANEEQVLLSRFAKDQATHSEVKALAVTLEKEHQSNWEQLKRFSPQIVASANAADRADRTETAFRAEAANNRAEAATQNQTVLARMNDQAAKVDFLELQQEISTQCLKDSKEMLSSKEGAEFDKCFVGMQVAKHASMHSVLTVLQRHSSSPLQALIKSELETNTKHMEAAVNLMEKLAKSNPTNSPR
jgi:hypothetical protein